MQPATEQDAIMGPPPVPYQSSKSAEQEMTEKYKKLKRRYYELEERHRDVGIELQRAGERNVKMREERNILLDRIIELESLQRTDTSTTVPQAQSSAYPRSLNDARTRAAFMANLHRAAEEIDLEPGDGDPRETSRHMNAIADIHRRADLDRQLALEDEQLRESRRAKRKAKSAETNGKPRGRNGLSPHEGDFNSPPSPPEDFEAGYNHNHAAINVLQMAANGMLPGSPVPSVPGPDLSPGLDANIDPALMNSYQQQPNGQRSTTPLDSPKITNNPYFRGPAPGVVYPNPHPYPPPGTVAPSPIVYSPMIHYEPPVASSSKSQPNRHTQAPSPPDEELKGPKQKRARTQAAISKTFTIPLIPRDQDSRPILPLTVGIMTLISLGEICEREHFHSERYIFPIGYQVTRKYASTIDPNNEVVYHCAIIDAGYGPNFKIVPSDAPDQVVIAGTPTGAWSTIVKKANNIRSRNHSNSVSGPDFFGLGQNTIRHLIQELPGARNLRDYARQIFVEGGQMGARYAAISPALSEGDDSRLVSKKQSATPPISASTPTTHPERHYTASPQPISLPPPLPSRPTSNPPLQQLRPLQIQHYRPASVSSVANDTRPPLGPLKFVAGLQPS